MRRTLIIALGTAAALATAAVAMAITSSTGITTTTATFAADKVAELNTRSCTGADAKTYEVTRAHYTGAVTSTDIVLGGDLKIYAKTTYDATGKLGYLDGLFRVKDDDSRVSGRIVGTISDGKFVGFLDGKSRGNHARVLGNLSANFTAAAGFTDGKLGAGSSTAVLAVDGGPICKGENRPDRLFSVKGQVSAVGDGSVGSTITVAVKGPKYATCKRDATSPVTTGFPLGAKVEMKCAYASPDWILRGLKLDS